MEVTPLNPRGVRVSSGDGAQPHGRDMSLQKARSKPANEPVHQEIPRDLATENMAANLRRADPTLDKITAMRIAKRLLEPLPAPRWESEEEKPRPATSLDVKA